MADQFESAEREFLKLKGQLAAGRITQAQFDAALKDLMFQDAQGRYWMIGAESGDWYVHDGKQWVAAQPSRAVPPAPSVPPPPPAPEFMTQTPIPPTSPLTTQPPTPMVASPSSGKPAARSNNTTLVFAIGAIAVVCVIVVIGTIFATSQGLLKVSLSSPTNTPSAALAPLPTVAVQGIAPFLTVAPPSPTFAPLPTSAPTLAPTAAVKPTATLTPTLTASESITQADSLTLQSRFAEAAAIYQQVLPADPAFAVANAHWARLLDFQGQLEFNPDLYTLAISKTETAAQLAPANAEVATWLARAYDWNGSYDKAIAPAQNAVKLGPGSAQANAVLAEALLDNNNTADGAAAAQQAVQLDPNSADAHRAGGYYLFFYKKQQPDGVAEFEKAAQLEPNLAFHQLELGSVYRMTKNYDKSIAAYQRTLSLYPQALSADFGMASVYLDQQQYAQAIDALTQATQLNAKSAEAFYRLGRAYDAAGKCDQSIPAYQKTIELNPRANAAMTYEGLCQLKAGNLAAASDSAKKAAAIDPTFADTKSLLAAIAAAQATPIPPGLYVTGIRMDPAAPGHGQDVSFYATFLNTNSSTANLRWLVYIFKADTPTKSFGETASIATGIPQGTGEQKAGSTWRTGIGTCDNFIARAAWLDDSKKATILNKPDGTPYELAFSVC
jgi:tetratricopeptide (TPR) repeat protein